jgi:hypothetical protein
VASLELVGPDGVLARAEAAGPEPPTLEAAVAVDGPLWLCAVARGPRHPSVPAAAVFAHTSPVHVQVGGRPAVRAASARWLLDWLDRFEELLRAHGRFDDDAQRDEVLAVVARARPFYQSLVK